MQCPEDVSLLAFDDPEWSTLVTPQLSVIRQPATETGKTAWELMMRRVAGNTGRPRKVVLEAEIVLRDSVRELKTTRARRPVG